MVHFLVFAVPFAILVAALVGERIALVALATLFMIGASLVALMIALPLGSPNSGFLWLIPLGWAGVVWLGRRSAGP